MTVPGRTVGGIKSLVVLATVSVSPPFRSLRRSAVGWLSFIRSFVCSFVRSFVRSFESVGRFYGDVGGSGDGESTLVSTVYLDVLAVAT